MTRSIEAKRRRNKKNRQRWRAKRANARVLTWFPPAPAVDPDVAEHRAAQLELLEEIPDGADCKSDDP